MASSPDPLLREADRATRQADRLLNVVAWLLLVASAMLSLSVRFSHPELTETQLLLTFWPVWLACATSCSVAVWLMRIRARKHQNG